MLPKTIACTLTAVPMLSSILFNLRYSIARSLFQLSNTALMATRSCSFQSFAGNALLLVLLKGVEVGRRSAGPASRFVFRSVSDFAAPTAFLTFAI